MITIIQNLFKYLFLKMFNKLSIVFQRKNTNYVFSSRFGKIIDSTIDNIDNYKNLGIINFLKYHVKLKYFAERYYRYCL